MGRLTWRNICCHTEYCSAEHTHMQTWNDMNWERAESEVTFCVLTVCNPALGSSHSEKWCSRRAERFAHETT